jgi:uncharacterized membrane protein
MRTRIRNLWYSLSSSYWFIPLIMALTAIGFSYGLYVIDRYLIAGRISSWWLYSGNLDGARTILTAIASSMMTIASIVFSISIVMLSTTITQYGSLLVRNFMNDKTSQFVFGMFVGTFIYCLLLLNTYEAAWDHPPSLSVSVGILLGILSVGFLVFFIHHMSASIQSNNVVAKAGKDLRANILRLYPKSDSDSKHSGKGDEGGLPSDFEQWARPIVSDKCGYLQAINLEGLLAMASKHDLFLQLLFRPGDFVDEGRALARAGPAESLSEGLEERIRRAFILGTERSLEQDVEFALNEIIEVAARALSPSLNDPLIALNCLNWLGVGLHAMAEVDIPPPYHYDSQNRLRMMTTQLDFGHFVDAMFNKIRQYVNTNISATMRLLEIIAEVSQFTRREEDRAVLMRHAVMLEQGSRRLQTEKWERKEIEERYRMAVRALHMGKGSE